MYRTAPQPTRATTSMTLAWGLVNIPLSVFTGTETTRVERREFFNGDPNVAVGRTNIRKDTGDPIETSDVTRMAQASNGTWVVLTDEEIATCTSPKGTAEVLSFVPLKAVDEYLTENVVQVRPKVTKGKADPAATRAFALLLTAMSKRKVAALVKVSLRGPARFALLLPSGDLRLVFTADAVRTAIPVDGDFKFTKQETDLAVALIDAVGIDTPMVTDDTAPVVQRFVDAKAAGAPAPAKSESPAIPADIMAAISASIDAKKKAA